MIRDQRHFLIPYFLFLLGVGVCLLFSEKEQLHLFLNEYNHPVADLFFRVITYAGDGIIVAIIAFTFLFIKVRHSLLIFLSYALSAITTQLLKHLAFNGSPRPVTFFKDTGHELYLVPGVEINYWNSFPSGHSSAAFTLFFCLGMITSRPFLKALMFFISLLAAYSRVYLSQHFLSDIYAGSVIGIISAMIIFKWMSEARHFKDKEWLDRSILYKRKHI